MRQTSPSSAQCVSVRGDALRGRRWDPGFWLAETALPVPSRPLGDFIDHITYGPIVTGRRPEPADEGIVIIDQKAIRATGIVLDQAVTVAEGCAYDLPRCRLEPRDIVLCRSGAGTLAKKRFTVFDRRIRATVSCFVDLIRLRDVNPYYVVTFLRSRPGWAQIERLINGVGTPNLSFGEIRSLRIPDLRPRDQDAVETAWKAIRRPHAQGQLEAAERELDRAAAALECTLGLSGDDA
ncbi:restriction endonuclease subunit S [Planctomycetota bacterium]